MIEAPSFTTYLNKPRDQLLSALAHVCSDLCNLHQECALAESAEIEARVDGWLNSGEDTIKGREWAATTNAASPRQTLIDRKADLAVKTEEKWFLLRLLDGDSS